MKALLQRVSRASVSVNRETVAEIERGVLVLLGLDQADNESVAGRLVEKVLNYRLFPDEQGRMNCSVRDIEGGVLVVSQFTLCAETQRGLRPGFSNAMPPQQAEPLYQKTLEIFRLAYPGVAAGIFAADMQVSLINDGPVTFLLEIAPD